MAFAVQLFDPWLSRILPEGGSEELSLAALQTTDAHVHGELAIVIDGARLPHLGFFGPRDVCVGTWVRELVAARRALAAGSGCCHTFDEGEQGQPAFKFERIGDSVEVSVVDSAISDGIGDAEWGTRSCTLAEFHAGIAEFLMELASTLEKAAPGIGKRWVTNLERSG